MICCEMRAEPGCAVLEGSILLLNATSGLFARDAGVPSPEFGDTVSGTAHGAFMLGSGWENPRSEAVLFDEERDSA